MNGSKMEESYCINLSYQSPSEDFDRLMGYNVDGTINVKFSLLNLKDLLLQNIYIIDSILEVSEHIINIIPTEDGSIDITIDSKEIAKKLMDNDIIKQNNNNILTPINNEVTDYSDEETNMDRLRMIDNLVNIDKVPELESISSDSEYESESDNIIKDYRNMYSIVNKYFGLLGNIDINDSNFERK